MAFKVVFLRLAQQEAYCLEAGQHIEDELADSGHRKRQDQTRQPPQLSEQQQGENGHQGIDAHLGPHHIGGDEVAFQDMYEQENAEYPGSIPVRVFRDQRNDHGQGRADEDADIGNDHQEAAQETEEQRGFDPQPPETDRVQGADNDHHFQQAKEVVLNDPIDLLQGIVDQRFFRGGEDLVKKFQEEDAEIEQEE